MAQPLHEKQWCGLILEALTKVYADPVLEGVGLTLVPGEVLALTGENGAGKSTLSKIIAGVVMPTSGSMRWSASESAAEHAGEGAAYEPQSRRDAERAGIRMVLQELSLVPTLSVAENLFIDRLPHRLGWIDRRSLDTMARKAMARIGLDEIDPDCPVGSLGIGHQQMVEIARALIEPCKVLILDEPTAMLSEREVMLLFAQVRRLRAAGVAVVYISHRLDELAHIADRVAVLRNGRLVALEAMSKSSTEALVKLMAGRERTNATGHAFEQRDDSPRLRVSGLCRGFVQDVSFDVRAGEIFGLAGLVGAGRTEVLRMIFGADIADAGAILVDTAKPGEPAMAGKQSGLQPVMIRSPAAAVRHGIAFISEDRKGEGLLLSLSVGANIALGNERHVSAHGWLDRALEQALAQRFISGLGIRCNGPCQLVGALSGGNQQKVLIARWLERDCPVMLLDEPTRGIDVGAKADLYEVMRTLASRGKAIVVVSSDLRELVQICSRIGVMSAGRLAAVFERGHWSQDAMLAAAFSAHAQVAQRGPARTPPE